MTPAIELRPRSQRHHTEHLTPHALTNLGFDHSRPYDNAAGPNTVPDGVDLIALTGRTRTEATR